MCSKTMVAGGFGAMVVLRTAPYIHQTAGPDGILHVFLVPLYTVSVRRRSSWTGWRSRCYQAPYTKGAAQAPLGWPGRWGWGHGGPEDRAIHPPDRRPRRHFARDFGAFVYSFGPAEVELDRLAF